jgi:tetratricopeptide (TPR) repeat protein
VTPLLLAVFALLAQDRDTVDRQAMKLSDPPLNEIYRVADLQLAGNAEAAIAVCRKYLSDRQFDPQRFPTGSAERIAASIVRGNAQAILAPALEASAKYDDALVAYRDSVEKYPVPSWCGNAVASQHVSSAMGQGRCLEHLGRHKEAVPKYFAAAGSISLCPDQGASARIVMLYEAAGQMNLLRDELARRDKEFVDRWTTVQGKPPDPDMISSCGPSVPIRRILAIVDEEKAAHWDKLIESLHNVIVPQDIQSETMRRLARHAEGTVPLLAAELGKGTAKRGLIAYTLALCGGPDAVAALKKAAEQDLYTRDWDLVLCGLSILGKPGQDVLKTLAATPAMSDLIDRVIKGKRFPLADVSQFPPIPAGLKLD